MYTDCILRKSSITAIQRSKNSKTTEQVKEGEITQRIGKNINFFPILQKTLFFILSVHIKFAIYLNSEMEKQLHFKKILQSSLLL